MELSYVDLLTLLSESIATDKITCNEESEILEHIEALERLLWRYSY